MNSKSSLKETIINETWYFWDFGWAYLPEVLIPIMKDVEKAFFDIKDNKEFLEELKDLQKNYIWRPSPLIHAKRLSEILWWAQIYLKNEWCNHTWAHKINHCIWQALIAKHLWKKRIIAETWAWQHGIATASICAKLWLECVIYMWEKDYDRQRPNVIFMELAWAKVIPITSGNKTLRDAVNASIKDLINHSDTSYYLLWTACGPHPYPSMNVFFQKVMSEELKIQTKAINISPDYLIACLGWGSNSLWFFYEYLDDLQVNCIGVEAWGKWIKTWKHAARFTQKKIAYAEWFKSYFLQDTEGQILDSYSISAGLDYSWVSPQVSYLEQIGRVMIDSATDNEALNAVSECMRLEGILPALESAHWIAYALSLAPQLPKEKNIICNISGRWEKDLFITAPKFNGEFLNYLSSYLKNYE